MRHHSPALVIPAFALVLALGACASAPAKPRGIFDLSDSPGTSSGSATGSRFSDIPQHNGNSGFSGGGANGGGYDGGARGTGGGGTLGGGTLGSGTLGGSTGGSPGY